MPEYKDTLDLHPMIEGTDPGGSPTITMGLKEKTVKGILVPLSGRQQYIDARKSLNVNYKFICGYDLAITDRKRFIRGIEVYEIIFPKDPNSLHHHLEVDLASIK
jgi:hypothetical protein